jgi:hypothetical protein
MSSGDSAMTSSVALRSSNLRRWPNAEPQLDDERLRRVCTPLSGLSLGSQLR